MNCSKCDWKSVSRFTSICSIHNKAFNSNERCPLASTTNSQPITTNLQGVGILKRKYVRKVKDSIFERFHSYGVKFNAIVEWDALFKYEQKNLRNNVSYKRIEFDKGYVRVFRKSILVILRSKSEVVGLSVREAELVCRRMVNDILDLLPSSIKVSDRDVVSLHNAFVNHPFAKKEVSVSINDEKRFISDNSKGYSEFEAISPSHAISDSECIEDDMVSLIDKGLSRDVLAQSIKQLIDDRKYYAENLKSHVQAIQDLSKGVNELREQVRRDRIKSFIDKYR